MHHNVHSPAQPLWVYQVDYSGNAFSLQPSIERVPTYPTGCRPFMGCHPVRRSIVAIAEIQFRHEIEVNAYNSACMYAVSHSILCTLGRNDRRRLTRHSLLNDLIVENYYKDVLGCAIRVNYYTHKKNLQDC